VEEVVEIRHPPFGRSSGPIAGSKSSSMTSWLEKGRWLPSPRVRGKRLGLGLFRLLVADRGLVLIAIKDEGEDGLAAQCHFSNVLAASLSHPGMWLTSRLSNLSYSFGNTKPSWC
jgi:hypothetical protein